MFLPELFNDRLKVDLRHFLVRLSVPIVIAAPAFIRVKNRGHRLVSRNAYSVVLT